ncbi:hypothetical protein CWI38_2539p0030, partial [Hamiltosporidium tvaerminnensis]
MENTKNTKTLEDLYQKKTPLEHILHRPDTYIGSIEKETQTLFVLTEQPIEPTSVDWNVEDIIINSDICEISNNSGINN